MDKYIGYRVLPRTVKKIVDLDSKEFLALNPDLKARITTSPDGKERVFKWQGGQPIEPIRFGYRFSMGEYSHFCFKVYNEKATNTKLRLRLNLVADNDRYIQGGVCGKVIELDFEGWKEFRILRDHLTVAYPPPFFDSVSVQASGDLMNADIPENVVYFTTVTAERERLELDVPEGVCLDDPALYEDILEKFEMMTTGTPEVWDMPQYLDKVQKGDESCEKAWAQFKETWCDGQVGKLFGYDIQRRPWVDEYNVMRIYNQLLSMASAYPRHGSKFYKNAELLEDIKKGLEYTYVNYYGENLYTSTTYGNWWPWWIGTPSNFLPILVLLRRELGRELVCRYAAVIKFLMPFPYGSGSNKINMSKNTLITAALLHDAEYICLTKHFMMTDLDYFVDTFGGDGGFYPDGSFLQHGNHPYQRGYGIELLQALSSLMNCIKGSAFEFIEAVAQNQYRWIFENFRHQVFYKNFSASNAGRGVTRNVSEIAFFKDLCRHIIYMRAHAPDEWKPKFDSLIRRFMLNAQDDFSYLVWPHLAKYCVDLYKDESVIPEPDYLTTRVFKRMARVDHHNKNYGAALNLSSDKIHKYESINKENEHGWYFSDGFLFVYPYETGYDYNGDFFHFASPYLRASTTINTAERIAKNISSFPNGSPYAGGVECGKYGSAGFILKYDESCMYRGTHKDVKDTKITANKSWFFLDNEIVCLGSGIKDASGTPVITCVENRLWRDGDVLTLDGEALIPEGETEKSAKYAHFTNMGGYVYLDESKITYNKTTRKNHRNKDDAKTNDFLEIVIHHGIGNETLNGSYAYAYLPEQSAEQTAQYAKNPDIEILCVSEKTHAVIEKKLGIVACNFFEENSGAKVNVNSSLAAVTAVKSVSADTPCSVMVTKGENGEYTISVSDPTQNYRNTIVSIEIEGVTEILSSDAKINTSIDSGVISILIDSQGSLGQTFNLTVK